MGKTIDISGQKFGKLTAIKFIEIKKDYEYYWLFRCSCGVEKILAKGNVKSGKIKSCGCLQREMMSERQITHGMYATKFYTVWINIQARCNNPKQTGYKNYGGRGIKVCKRWRHFEQFRDDMLDQYVAHIEKYGTKNTSIDRIDNNENYCKENCRWTTRKVQNRNKRTNKLITYKGQVKCLVEWAECLGIPYKSLSGRLNQYNWSVEKAFTT